MKTMGPLRRPGIMLRRWEIGLRMRELHGDPDVWLPKSRTPEPGSPWNQSRAHSAASVRIGSGSAVDLLEAEARLRLEAIQDYFVALRAAMRTRSVYSLHVMCRTAIEACAFSAWVFDPVAVPEERLLRGLILSKQSTSSQMKSLRSMRDNGSYGLTADERQEVERAHSEAKNHAHDAERIIGEIGAELVARKGESFKPPSRTRRVREMLCDDMGMPQGLDAYHRLSRVVHSEASGIIGTWNLDGAKPFIDYYTFLEPLHLALCSIHFALEQRGACWGETYKASKLHKIIRRVERIIEVEPGVQLV